jgi:hypothetical protein
MPCTAVAASMPGSALILASRSARNDSAPSTVSCGSIGYLCTPGVLMLLTRWRLRQL